MTTYSGTSRSETLDQWNYGFDWFNEDTFIMRGGDDYVETQRSHVSYYFSGGTGRDHFYGYDRGDIAYGGSDTDHLWGYGGNDDLYGDSGNDAIKGGDGNDWISGGLGRDNLSGEHGYDTYYYRKGDSNLKTAQCDVIQDWSRHDNVYTTGPAGNSRNYGEAATHAGNIESARTQAESTSSLTNDKYVFLYNQKADRGYLLMDLDGNHQFETGVVLKGAGSANDFSHNDLL